MKENASTQRREGAASESSQEDDARNAALVYVTDRLPGGMKFYTGSGPVEHFKFPEVNEIIFPGFLHEDGNAGGVIGKDVAPLFGGRIFADPNLCRFTLDIWIKIGAQAQGQNLASAKHDPVQVGWVVLVESQNLTSRKMVAGCWHGGNLT